jgi:hypothetical protein
MDAMSSVPNSLNLKAPTFTLVNPMDLESIGLELNGMSYAMSCLFLNGCSIFPAFNMPAIRHLIFLASSISPILVILSLPTI